MKYAVNFEYKTLQIPAKQALLKKAMQMVPETGFTNTTLLRACKELGYTPVTHTIVPRGPVELVEYFIHSNTMKLKELQLPEGTTKKIRFMCTERLSMTMPIIHRWPEAVKLMVQPQNTLHTAKHLMEMVDEMWHLAGDSSVDLNWYSKRMLLAGVYTSSEVFLCSNSMQDTLIFLDNRLNDVGKVGKTARELGQFANYGMQTLLGIVRSKQ